MSKYIPSFLACLLLLTSHLYASDSKLTVRDVLRSIENYEKQTGDATTFAFEKSALNRIITDHLPQLQKDIELELQKNNETKEKNQAWDHVVKEIEQLIEKAKVQGSSMMSPSSIQKETTAPVPTPPVTTQEEPKVSQSTTTALSTTTQSQGDIKSGTPVVPTQSGTTVTSGQQPSVTVDTLKQAQSNLKPTPVMQKPTPPSGTIPPENWSKLSVKERAALLSKQGFQSK